MSTPLLRRDYTVDPDLGVALLPGTPFTQRECEEAADRRLSERRWSHDPELGAVWVSGGGYSPPEQ
ncbi:MAG: hypothetical protein J7513_02130 [Solirubrobacteraceae bacterium]|nr:hypothetical protein [Solirubrobacteraceae bacterium]